MGLQNYNKNLSLNKKIKKICKKKKVVALVKKD